ncbi:hypothetical protein SD81_040260 [Tolypothrix campylonemoides VB511288]|nr:hypothetical protein SD81_040260 [Tolypothrix campylonemoides VB511288]
MLKYNQIQKLEIAKELIEEVTESPEFSELNIHPDVTLHDSIQGVQEVLKNHYPCGYKPPKLDLSREPYIRSWHEKLSDYIFVGLGNVAGTALIVAALSACISIVGWGASEIKGGMGYKKSAPDFAASSQMYRGLAISSLGLSLCCSVCASVLAKK